MASASKLRQPRLRASCDGCFLAKVKCSKARPICSRCLACGIECRYSPSSRSGKPKADTSHTTSGHNQGHHSHHSHHTPQSTHSNHPSHGHNHSFSHIHHTPGQDTARLSLANGLLPLATDDKSLLYAATAGIPELYTLDTTMASASCGWQTLGLGMDTPNSNGVLSAGSRHHPSMIVAAPADLALLGMDDPATALTPVLSGSDVYHLGGMPWPASGAATTTTSSMAPTADFGASVGMPLAVSGPQAPPPFEYAMQAWIDPAIALDWAAYTTPSSANSSLSTSPAGHPAGPAVAPPMHQPAVTCAPSTVVSSPSTTPSLHWSSLAAHKAVPAGADTPGPRAGFGLGPSPSTNSTSDHSPGACLCFATCLNALQALHSAGADEAIPTAPPPSPQPQPPTSNVDGVLAHNRRAVDACATLLSCPHCMRRWSGTHTAALLLLATVLGQAASGYYKMAGRDGDGEGRNNSDAAVLQQALGRLEEVYGQFRTACDTSGALSEDAEVSAVMVRYVGQTLGAALDMVNQRAVFV